MAGVHYSQRPPALNPGPSLAGRTGIQRSSGWSPVDLQRYLSAAEPFSHGEETADRTARRS